MRYDYENQREFSVLTGETIVKIEGLETGSSEVKIKTESGRDFVLFHDQDCCESVSLNEIHGDKEDILNYPILFAEESTNQDNPPEDADSFTWTFYRLQTIKGSLQLRWLGESNGYYSESVSFYEGISEEKA